MADYKRRIKIQPITLTVGAAGATVQQPDGATLDINYKYCTGIMASILGDESNFNLSVFNKFEIAGQQIFPPSNNGIGGMEAKIIASVFGTDVSPWDKWYKFQDSNGLLIPIATSNQPVSIEYKDGNSGGVVPYKLIIYFRLENLDEDMLNMTDRFIKWQWNAFLKEHPEYKQPSLEGGHPVVS